MEGGYFGELAPQLLLKWQRSLSPIHTVTYQWWDINFSLALNSQFWSSFIRFYMLLLLQYVSRLQFLFKFESYLSPHCNFPSAKSSQSYCVFLKYYLENNIFLSATATDFTPTRGLNFSMAMLVSPIVTILARQYEIHVPTSLGIVFQTTGFITASFATQIWHYISSNEY